MIKNLVIVESPAKAKTIQKYLGNDFKVLSSVGHIRSIAKKSKQGKDAIDVKNGFATTYEIDPEKKKVVSELKKAVKESKEVWLATDEDREGESIAWHLCEVLGLNLSDTKRIVFHEITKPAIEKAVKNPKQVNMSLVKAQQARQILDRIVGFELSPIVWQKVPGGKSAGRVQSPAVKLLVEKEKEIETFQSDSNFKLSAIFTIKNKNLFAEIPKRFNTENEAHNFLKKLIGSEFIIGEINKSPSIRKASPPFTTSTLQQEANSKLGFSAKATMSSAQKLYQEGKITYMRTDSITLSKQAQASIAKFIEKSFGNEYIEIKNFKTKVANAQEAHEAIRPTDINLEKASANEYDQKLYNLIRNRTIASQMAPAKIEKTVASINISQSPDKFEARGEIILFEGFLKIYKNINKDEKILPDVKTGDILQLKEATAKESFSRPPARYSEGSLVKRLEELGIGRPSTYATIISTIQTRGYAQRGQSEGSNRDAIEIKLSEGKITRDVVVEKTGSDKSKLLPTSSGEVLTDFLSKYFKDVVDYGFTAKIEKDFDHIANEKLERNKMLEDFYIPFHKLIENSKNIERKDVSQIRELGIDPKTKLPVFARYGRFGPTIQLGSGEGDNKPRFAPMPKDAKINSVTLDQALFALQLPRTVGKMPDGEEIQSNIGRFGPYLKYKKMFVSIKEPNNPYDIGLKESIRLIEEKIKLEESKKIAEFENGIRILNGRYGPYITDGKKNVKVPKEIDPTKINLEKALEILQNAPTSKRRFRKKAN